MGDSGAPKAETNERTTLTSESTVVQDQIRQRYHTSKQALAESQMCPWDLHMAARDLQLPMDDVVLVKSVFDTFDRDGSGQLEMAEFEQAVVRMLELLLSEHERDLRSMAKVHDITPDAVEHIKRCFDTYDTDGSGEVDVDEFRQVLHKALEVPSHLELPDSRVMHFWSQIDNDNSGRVVFEEFLRWWLKYFDEGVRSKHEKPFEGFY